jgi:hypothetical protein
MMMPQKRRIRLLRVRSRGYANARDHERQDNETEPATVIRLRPASVRQDGRFIHDFLLF